jgi:hypothetical protein
MCEGYNVRLLPVKILKLAQKQQLSVTFYTHNIACIRRIRTASFCTPKKVLESISPSFYGKRQDPALNLISLKVDHISSAARYFVQARQ